MKKNINIYDYTQHILKQLKKGVLITSKVDEKVNSMTVSWGQIGIEWHKQIFTTFIRTGRYTHQMIKEKKEFTVNIPMETRRKDILTFCGTKSGKDYDKVKELNLTLIEGDKVNVPGIKELPLTLECKVVYYQIQDPNFMTEEIRNHFYPLGGNSSTHDGNSDHHTMFIGEIVGAYIAE
jgi:flavin reductase (DIM6/NTAB) family NADH-FMN oxidoreductase RutF